MAKKTTAYARTTKGTGQDRKEGTGQGISKPAAPGMITKAVGRELRRVREHLGWSRSAVVKRMSRNISGQALANYEYGIRPCTVEKLVEICESLGVSAADVLGLALQRAHIEQPGIQQR